MTASGAWCSSSRLVAVPVLNSMAALLPQVAANLGREGYLEDIAKATDDIDVQLVFNNAGYLLTGFFHNRCGRQGVPGGVGACCLAAGADSNNGPARLPARWHLQLWAWKLRSSAWHDRRTCHPAHCLQVT